MKKIDTRKAERAKVVPVLEVIAHCETLSTFRIPQPEASALKSSRHLKHENIFPKTCRAMNTCGIAPDGPRVVEEAIPCVAVMA